MPGEISSLEDKIRKYELDESVKNAVKESMPADRIAKIEIELAERKPIERLVQLLIYFLAAISVVVGIFGIKQLSDINSIISSEVKNQFPRDSQKMLEYKRLIEETSELKEKYNQLYGKYESALKAYDNLDKITDDFDIEGKVARVFSEVDNRSGEELLDEKWRLSVVATLKLLSESQKKKNYTSDFIFNAAQTASRLQQNSLAFELMQGAFEKRPHDAPIRAGRLSAIIAIGDEKGVNDAFADLMKMVENLDPNSPHIVLSEAWNAAENLRRYGELIGAIDNLLEKKGSAIKPSYAYFIKSFALTRTGRPGDLEKAKITANEGVAVLKLESPNSVWSEASLRELGKCKKVFIEAESVTSSLALLDREAH